ncbi:ABC transporter ATP-binding protein [Tessaracoccus rhinocerotis]|uniref:ABC transporter ATP-binding protein n=1 Tax=Tessaracoccus rhinocerotis TaxID=1689449 RepID=A0A553JZQ6_9ACTN|nr:ABC transporter ATP-binding protein [Tessaracoccus rhinocerotis]
MTRGEDSAVIVDDLHITYKVSLERKTSLKNALVRRTRKQEVRYREVNALKGVSFEVPQGRCTGFIGANGAGKSTLMRAVAGILPPTGGQIEVNGKVSTLLALGVGFNSALTGRENVILGGMAAGLSRGEVHDKFQEIADFADLGDFIDMPMRTYSSGMFSRLAFSVAVNMHPDILIIDEALSAGDAKFKEKANQKMSELMGTAGTMLLVSHALATIQELSDEVIWLHKGRLIHRGDPKETCERYLDFLKVGDEAIVMEDF